MIHYLLTDYVLSLAYNSENDISWQSSLPPFLELAPGAEYTVTLNGVTYVLVAQAGAEEGREIVFVGNETLTEGEELPPFLIQYVYDIETKTYSNYFYHNGEIAEAIFTVSVDLEKVNVLLYNKKGKTVEYTNVETITTDTVITGAQATFTRGHLVAPIVQPLDMKNGDQVIDADGKMFKQVTIVKPEALVPENIKKHVNIGGIEGTFAGDEVEKTSEINYAIEYTKAYSDADMDNFISPENEGKYIRVMFDPYNGIFGDGWVYLAYYQCVFSNDAYKLEKVDTDSIPLLAEQVIEADEDTVLTKVVLPKPDTLTSQNIKKNVDIGGVSGSYIGDGYAHTEDNLVFKNGEMTLTPTIDRLFEKVIIKQPSSLIAGNIKEGVQIAGVTGSYSADALPTLYAPTAISNLNSGDGTVNITGDNTGAYISVTNPYTKNGYFVNKCQLFIEDSETKEDIVVAEKAVSGNPSAIYFYANDWLISSLTKEKTIKAKFFGNYFKPSSLFTSPELVCPNNTSYGGIGITSMVYDIKNIDLDYYPKKVYYGQYISNKIKAKTGYYLPKKIEAKVEGTVLDDVSFFSDYGSYDNQTGAFILKYYRAGATGGHGYAGGTIRITAEAPSIPWLKDFTTEPTIDKNLLTIPRSDLLAERAEIRLNGNLIQSTPYPDYSIKTLSTYTSYRTTYTTASSANNVTHTMKSSGSYYGYHIYRCTFKCSKPTNVVITYGQYNYTTYNCGFISKVDYKFSANYNAESSANCLFYGPKSSSTTITNQKLTVQIPAGEHTIDFKWRGYYNYTAYYFNFSLDFPNNTGDLVVDLREISALRAPGDYSLTITGEAENYTGTDPVTVTYTSEGATVEGDTLYIGGEVSEEILTLDYSAVNDETLFCDLPEAEINEEQLIVKEEVIEETLTTEYAAVDQETLIYSS